MKSVNLKIFTVVISHLAARQELGLMAFIRETGLIKRDGYDMYIYSTMMHRYYMNMARLAILLVCERIHHLCVLHVSVRFITYSQCE